MSKEAHDIFALVVYFLGWDWVLKHISIWWFKIYETSRHELANNFKNLLKWYGLTKETIIDLKDKGLICMPWQLPWKQLLILKH
jgi:hypothetical protein